jgi:GlpG protein
VLLACVVIFILQNIRSYHWLTDRLEFSSYTVDERGRIHGFNLDDIGRGQFWRLITPALMHANPIHIVFNMLMFRQLATLIEVRRGTLRLAVLFLIAAAVSNYGQYLWMERIGDVSPFLGMSGVVYALFGYVWMKGIYQPEQRMGVSSASVNVMILWLFFCMSGALGPIANAAHFVGLAVGIGFGLMGF